MKQLLLLAITLCTIHPATAQSWRLHIKKNNGTETRLMTTDVSNMTFIEEESTTQLPDKNTDQILIKEVYNGGTMLNDGSKSFHFDKCIILYNNCPQQAVINNLCLALGDPYNAQAAAKWVDKGKLLFEDQGFVPALDGIWYYPYSLVFEPFSQVVINVHGAIDNTHTVSTSVNYANPDYYCMYDPESGYNNTSYYPAPYEGIPTSHYLRAIRIGQANAWALSTTSPAVYIFQPQNTTITDYAANPDNFTYSPGSQQTLANRVMKIPSDWILDGVEIFTTSKREDCQKRLPASIDGGYVWLTNQQGHTVYRNVDKEFTEERPENAGRLVYNYALGTDSSTDPSGIDAEASIRNGAHIYYLDNNNSSTDFHERQRCSLRP